MYSVVGTYSRNDESYYKHILISECGVTDDPTYTSGAVFPLNYLCIHFISGVGAQFVLTFPPAIIGILT